MEKRSFDNRQRLNKGSLSRKRVITGYLFISPILLGILIWLVFPMSFSLWLSGHEWDLISEPSFVSLGNFKEVLSDELFWQSLKVTLYFSGISVPLSLITAFLVALLLNIEIKGKSVFRAIYYLPSVVPVVANCILWVWILNSEFGLLNFFLSKLGLSKVLWLQEPKWTMPALIIMSLWGIGPLVVLYLAGLQGISRQLYEAAEIDGANWGNKFLFITIPMMSPVIFFNLIIGLINAFQTFTQAYIMTEGGPQNATLFYVFYIYQNAFQWMQMGYACALAWILFATILICTLFIFRHFERLVYYEGT